jgi:AAA domain
MPFTPATKEIGYVKGSLYGPPGTGKTTVMAMLLIYLSKTYHNSAPVAWLASEKGVDFVLDFFKAESVPLMVSRSRSFIDLRSATREARNEGCCAIGVDSITHFWQELFSEGMKARGPRLQKIMQIKEEWAPFSQDFQDSPVHFLVTGRLGFNWEEAEVQNDKTGEITREVSRGGSKIKAEGDFGHEPDLEIEMSAVEDPDFLRWEKVKGKNRRTFKSQMLHVATLKKSRVWALNGKAFSWKDQAAYKLGYYKSVAECFRPHFDQINIGGSHNVMTPTVSSEVLFTPNSDTSNYEFQIKRQIALENWDATMSAISGGQTKDAIRQRGIIGTAITGTRSKTEFERQSLTIIERQLEILLALEVRLKEARPDPEKPISDRELTNCIALAVKDVENPSHREVTYMEALLGESVARAKGPQPVTPIDEARELAGD